MTPTGLTADIYENKEDYTFDDYVWRCARHMMPLVLLRDDPNAEIPEQFEPDPLHRKLRDEAIRRQNEVAGWSDEQAEAEAQRAYAIERARRESARGKVDATHERYEAMLDQVDAWEPGDTNLEPLRELMRSQLEQSLDFDCNPSQTIPDPVRLDGRAYRERELNAAGRDRRRHEEEWERERERTDKRNLWLASLRLSLRRRAEAVTP